MLWNRLMIVTILNFLVNFFYNKNKFNKNNVMLTSVFNKYE